MTSIHDPRNAGLTPGNVVAMNRFQSGQSLSPIRQVEAYWAALREGNDVPRRAQIDPRGLENVLGHTFMVERIAPGVARFRLAGQHLEQVIGLDVRGMPLTVLFTPAGRTLISAVLEHLFDAPSVAELTLQANASTNCKGCEARMILLPLRSDAGDINRALGAFIADATPGAGTQFDVIANRFHPTGDVRPQPSEKTEMSAGFAEGPAPLGGRAPHLRLVTSD